METVEAERMPWLQDEQREHLEREGYVLLPAILSTQEAGELAAHLDQLWASEGELAGIENYIEAGARRLANLVDKGEIFRPIFRHPQIVGAVRAVLGPDIRLSSLNARAVRPGADPRMPLHADTYDAGVPDPRGYYACQTVWMLDDFTQQNGATRVVPGTHRSGKVPKQVLADVYAPHPEEVLVEGKVGDVLVFNGHLWHAGGSNHTDRPRRALLAFYTRADKPQQLKQKDHLSPEVQAKMTAEERELLGLDD